MDFSAYVGIPWEEHGRTTEACDCWGLLRAVYLNILGVELPSYSPHYATTRDRQAIAALVSSYRGDWREVRPGLERPLDAVLMTEAGVPMHIGLVVKPGHVLHIVRDGFSAIESYRAGKLSRRIAGFFRYEGAR
jgi:cell wall-associated NlpC family hydrolase